jgi:uncharacterized protein
LHNHAPIITKERDLGMSRFDHPSFYSEEFVGRVRVFPLPNLVLFPNVMQPLHIFEPRYRELFEDALAGDGLIAMATLAPGWERNYEGRPALYSTACLSRIVSHRRLPDGAYNVLLVGLRRVRLLRELPASRRFREAKAELCDDVCTPGSAAQRTIRRQLRAALLGILPAAPEAREQLDQLLRKDVPLAMLTDVLGFLLAISPEQKQSLLAQLNVRRRAALLLSYLSEAATEFVSAEPVNSCFPPQFSVN